MCDCGKNENYEMCCARFIRGSAWPETAEELMRSRYSAFVHSEIDYIQKTSMGPAAKEFNLKETSEWSKNSKWLSLEILKVEKGELHDSTGSVEFVAKYQRGPDITEHHEVSQFKKDNEGHWKFFNGESHTHEEGQGHQHHSPIQQVIRDQPKLGRNDPCHCGSGKKFKKCHGANE